MKLRQLPVIYKFPNTVGTERILLEGGNWHFVPDQTEPVRARSHATNANRCRINPGRVRRLVWVGRIDAVPLVPPFGGTGRQAAMRVLRLALRRRCKPTQLCPVMAKCMVHDGGGADQNRTYNTSGRGESVRIPDRRDPFWHWTRKNVPATVPVFSLK